MSTATLESPALDYAALKQRQHAVWSSGDYAILGTTLQIMGENLCEAVDVRAGSQVLDVAAGNGNATLAAARRFAHVTSTDYVGALLERGVVEGGRFEGGGGHEALLKEAASTRTPMLRGGCGLLQVLDLNRGGSASELARGRRAA